MPISNIPVNIDGNIEAEASADEEIQVRNGSRWKEALQNVTVEPVGFLLMFGIFSCSVITQNLYIDRICRVSLGYSAEQCRNISSAKDGDTEEANDIEVEVDALASKLSLYRGLIETLIPIGFAMFLGPWSDKHGYKFPLLLPVFGYLLAFSFYTLFSFLPNLRPEYLLFSSIPISLCGGMVAIVISTFSFISAVSTNETRSFRISVLEAAWFVGMPTGLLVGARVYKAWGFTPVFMTASCSLALALIYGMIFIREKKPEIPTEPSDCLKDMFNVEAVKETFYTVARRREGPRRLWIFLLIITSCLKIMTAFGPPYYLFTRYQFGWTEQEYSTYSTINGFLGVFGMLIMVAFFVKMWKVGDTYLGLTSSVGVVIANLIIAFVPRGNQYGWFMYLAAVIQMFGGMVNIMVRSMISKIVPKQELGKVFTFVAIGETAVPLISTAMYSLVFIMSEKQFAGAFSLVSAGINLWILGSFIYFCISMRSNPEILELEEDESDSPP